jgi:uncharacterized protein (TIGR03083 family)
MILDYAAALIEQNRLFGEAVFAGDLSMPVPTCPGWTLVQLLRHVGRGDRWAAQIIRDRTGSDLDPRLVPDGRPPDDTDGARAWLQAGPRILLDAVSAIGPEENVATFLGPRPAAWWVRRRLHEATVHRADAAIATGKPYELAPELAVDGIDEWLERLAVELPAARTEAIAVGQALAMRATDAGVQWWISGITTGIDWSHGASDSPSAVRLVGPAANLFLTLVRRRTLQEPGIESDGDMEVWHTWLAHTPL